MKRLRLSILLWTERTHEGGTSYTSKQLWACTTRGNWKASHRRTLSDDQSRRFGRTIRREIPPHTGGQLLANDAAAVPAPVARTEGDEEPVGASLCVDRSVTSSRVGKPLTASVHAAVVARAPRRVVDGGRRILGHIERGGEVFCVGVGMRENE